MALSSVTSVSWLLVLVLDSALVGQHGVLCSVVMNISAVFAFGDSTVDPGNNNWIDTVARANFKPYGVDFPGGKPTGRFSNGRISPDLFSELLGLKPIVPAYLDPSLTIDDFSTGANFASSGAGFDDQTSSILGALPIMKQLDNFEKLKIDMDSKYGLEESRRIVSKAVYIISCGTNDFVENYFLFHKNLVSCSLEEYERYLLKQVEKFFESLYSLGARYITLIGISPMGCMPLERTTSKSLFLKCKEGFNDVAKGYNGKLDALLQNLDSKLKDSIIILANPYELLERIYRLPWLYGFDVVDRGCVGTGLWEMSSFCEEKRICKDRSKYFFFDSFHPTEKANQKIVEYLYEKFFPKFKAR